jgi:hypothetical protein
MARFVRFEMAEQQQGVFRETGRFTQINPAHVVRFDEQRFGKVTLVFFPDGRCVAVMGTEESVLQDLLGTPLEQLARTGDE